MVNMEKINVLWMNNGKDELLSFLSNANERGIEIHTCKSMRECCEHLENKNAEQLDAVLLNYNARLDKETPNADNFGTAIGQLEDFPKIPYFVVCDETLERFYEKVIKGILKIHQIEEPKIYILPNSVSSLIDDIFARLNNSHEYYVKKKYKDEFELCDYRQELIDILVKYEYDLEGLKIDYNVPNNCRKLLESLTNSDLFNELYDVLDEDNFFKQEEHKFAPALVSAVLGKSEDKVPSYIKRSFHFCTEVCNDGSHELNGFGVNTLIQNGDAPYLNMSLVANFLNVLHWLNLHKEKGDLDVLMREVGENYKQNKRY